MASRNAASRGARCGRSVFLAALLLPLAAAPSGRCAEPAGGAAEAMALAAEGARAAEAKDFPAYLEKMAAAVALRPDFPQLLVNLAAAQVANERADEAIATLERLVKLGMAASPDKSEEFAALRGRKDFEAVVRKFANNSHPQGKGEMAFSLRNVTGWIEAIAWREKTREFLFGDVHHRTIWRRNKDNTLQRFTPEGDELLGVFGLAVDEPRGSLWAATAAVSAMNGYTPEQEGTAALAEIDLASGAVRRTVPVTKGGGARDTHLLGDVVISGDGTVFVSDSVGGTIWQLRPDGTVLEKVVESAEIISPQGIVVVADGAALLVADRVNGLLRVELPRGAVRRIEPPPDWTLIGIDGLVLAPDGDVIAIQNSTNPKRVLRITLETGAEGVSRVTVLESGHLTMAAPSSGCFGEGGEFHFIGNTGAARFEYSEAKPTAPRPVPVFKTKIAAPAKR